MTLRQSVGNRVYSATFSEHNGNRDEHGNPTYEVATDWVPVVTRWPCEMIATAGGEMIRGRQTTATTTHVLYGEYFGAKGIKATHRCTILVDDVAETFSVSAVPIDAQGRKMEMRVEVKRET